VTEVAVTQCDDQRCSYWTAPNSPPEEPEESGENNAKSECGDGTLEGPADMMGPLNIMAAIIPFESTWSTTTCRELQCMTCDDNFDDVDDCVCSRSFDVLLGSSIESMESADTDHLSTVSGSSSERSIEVRTTAKKREKKSRVCEKIRRP